MAGETTLPTGLALLREKFAPNQISKLPKPSKQQTEEVRADYKKGIRCAICNSWHHPQVVHLDYVGHAALTDRLLDADPAWSWEPCSFGPDGLPAFDKSGGLWIRLTVCGVTRLGYGNADAKNNADAGAREKEVIGDALRNAAMRFGAALDLWHKGVLHADDDAGAGQPQSAATGSMLETNIEDWINYINDSANVGELKKRTAEAEAACNEIGDKAALAKVQAASISKAAKAKKATA